MVLDPGAAPKGDRARFVFGKIAVLQIRIRENCLSH